MRMVSEMFVIYIAADVRIENILLTSAIACFSRKRYLHVDVRCYLIFAIKSLQTKTNIEIVLTSKCVDKFPEKILLLFSAELYIQN